LRAFSTLVLGAAAVLAAPAFAQDSSPAPAPVSPDVEIGGDSITLGLGVATVPDYEGSNDNRIIPFPAARGSVAGYSFSTRGPRLFVDLVKNEPGPTWDYQLGPVVSLNFNRVGDVEDDRVQALGKKKVALELGGYIGIGKTGVLTSDYDKLSASVAFYQDVTGIHKSYVITPQIDYGTPLSRKAYVGISGNFSYVGSGYADSYFGITRAQAVRSGLTRYNPDGGWKNWSLSALGNYAITGDLLGGLSAVAGVSYSRLLGDFKRSPIVLTAGDRDQWYGAVGLAYTF
jgi:MipA family protein